MRRAHNRTKTNSTSLERTKCEEHQNLSLVERQPKKEAVSNEEKHSQDSTGIKTKNPSRLRYVVASLWLLVCVVLIAAFRGNKQISAISSDPQLPESPGSPSSPGTNEIPAITSDPHVTESLITKSSEKKTPIAKTSISTSIADEWLKLGSLLKQRVKPLDRTQFFSFVHIPKAGGVQWWNLIFQTLVKYKTPSKRPPYQGNEKCRLFPPKEWGPKDELPLLYTLASAPHANYTLISLRSPLHHVFSQYSHCRYFKGPFHVKKIQPLLKKFKDKNNISLSRDEGFEKWLSLFIVESDNNLPVKNNGLLVGSTPTPYRLVEGYRRHRCYNPINVQSRFLTSSNKTDANLFSLEPEPEESIGNLRRYTDFVGILDFYHESKCLFYHRILLASKTNSSDLEVKPIKDYVDERCRCPWPESVFNEPKMEHHKDGKRSTMVDLNSTVKEMVATIAAKDMIMYKSALMDFFHEIMWLESPAQLNRRVMCDESLQKQELELAYLGLNVSSLYSYAKTRVM